MDVITMRAAEPNFPSFLDDMFSLHIAAVIGGGLDDITSDLYLYGVQSGGACF